MDISSVELLGADDEARGFFLSSYSFAGANQFQFAVWLTAGALLAFLGSLGVLRRRMSRR